MRTSHVFGICHCTGCGKRYAVVADPYFQGQFIILHRDTLEDSHIVVGGLVCLCTAPLTTPRPAAQTADGRWVSVAESIVS